MRTKSLSWKLLLVGGLLALLCSYPMQAGAEPFKSFDFTQNTGFLVDDSLVANGTGVIKWYGPQADPVAGTFSALAWSGQPPYSYRGETLIDPFAPPRDTQVSALKVEGFSGVVTTGADLGGGWSAYGEWETISRLYHQNNIIPTTAALTNAKINEVLVIGGVTTPLSEIDVTFAETLNKELCPLPNPVGTVCDDYFCVMAFDFAPLYFTVDGQLYEAEFQLTTNDLYPVDPVVLYDDETGQFKVYTGEGATSSLDGQMRIREVGVPEPATMALLGLGLLGIGIVSRRRVKK
jgi:hypothetical protein